MSFIQQLFTSRDNNANAAAFVGQQDRLWWDPVTNRIYYSDGATPGGIPVGSGGNATTNQLVNGAYEFVLDATGNITAPGSITVAGNITAANFITVGSNVEAGNILSSGIVSAAGNVSGNYFLGDGSQLTNLPTGGSNITVKNQGNTLTSALNTMNFTGNGVVATNVGNVVTVNITAGSGSGLPSQTGNAGKILSTDGTNPLWETMPGVFGLVIDGGDAAFASLDFIIDGGPA